MNDDAVTLRLGDREVRLTSVEARELESRAVEDALADRWWHSELKGALRSDPGQREVVVWEEKRPALRLMCEAVEAAGRLTPGLRELCEVASTPIPIVPRPPP